MAAQRGSAQRGSAPGNIVVLVVFAVLFLLETLGWVAAALRNPFGPEGIPAETLYFAGEALAILAAPAWFCAALWLSSSIRRRDAVLALGVILLVPWPNLIGAV